MKAAVHLNFPHTALVLGLEVMLSYRLVMVDNQVAEVGLAGNGIVAGDPLATSFARGFLYPALKATQAIATRLGVDMRLRVFVDDIRARVTAKTQEDAAKGAANVLNALLNNLEKGECEVSKAKTLLMGSTNKFRVELQRRLKNAGWHLPATTFAKDFGTALTSQWDAREEPRP